MRRRLGGVTILRNLGPGSARSMHIDLLLPFFVQRNTCALAGHAGANCGLSCILFRTGISWAVYMILGEVRSLRGGNAWA